MIQVVRAAIDFQGGSGPVLPCGPISLSVQWVAWSCGCFLFVAVDRGGGQGSEKDG